MRRREFIAGLGGAAAMPQAARAQQTLPVVGIISAAAGLTHEKRMAAFDEGLNESGFTAGQNVTIDYRFADGHDDRLPALAAQLVARQVRVLVTPNSSNAAQAARSATRDIPVVFSTANDPVKVGLVSSLARPEANVTGVYTFSTELGPKRLGLLRELLPGAKTIAVLVNPSNPSSEILREMQIAAHASGQQIRVITASSAGEIELAFDVMARERPDGFLIINNPLFSSRRTSFVLLAARHAIPAIYSVRDYPEAGGLMSYGTSLKEVYRQLGVYTGRILKGTVPADLPVVQSTRFEFVINLQAAKALGLQIPPTLLARADEVIE